jgi:hypothetical protein
MHRRLHYINASLHVSRPGLSQPKQSNCSGVPRFRGPGIWSAAGVDEGCSPRRPLGKLHYVV